MLMLFRSPKILGRIVMGSQMLPISREVMADLLSWLIEFSLLVP